MKPKLMEFTQWGEKGRAFDASEKPALWTLIHRLLGIAENPATPPADSSTIVLPVSTAPESLLAELRGIVGADQVCLDAATRLPHCYGKSFRDLYRARRGELGRVPDAVVFPGSSAEVDSLFAIAERHGASLIPFGGGTNIVGSVEPSPLSRGPVLTVNLRRMNRLLSLDEQSLVARFEVGILGPELEELLNARGYTLGHFPDSFEYSTLGGWLASRSAGMQSDQRGKIEDLVLGLRLSTPEGVIETHALPRSATGPDLNQLVVGSEGTLGIITEATMRISPLGKRSYRGFMMPTFESGVEFIQACWREGIPPATLRLSNPAETELGLTLKPRSTGVHHLLSSAVKAYLVHGKGYQLDKVCLMIAGWEGPAAVVDRQERAVLALLKRHGGFDLGHTAGKTWYARKYEYPLLRDLLMARGAIVDVTEMTVLWKDALSTYNKVHEMLCEACAGQGLTGYIGCHLSHVYANGVCLYFTFVTMPWGEDAMTKYLRIKKRAVDTLVAAGAAISHHHSIGYEHQPWMADYVGPTGLKALRGLKATLDPKGLCNPGKLLPSPESALDHYWPQPPKR